MSNTLCSKDDLNKNLVAVNAAYTANYGDVCLVNAGAAVLAGVAGAGGAVTVTLPAPRAGQEVVVKRLDGTTNAISVAPGTGVQIDNGTAGTAVVITVSGVAFSKFVSDGSNWWTIA